MELYRERGFDQTTTAEIAARAGVNERTFFRHFPDKREVLFGSEAELRTVMTQAVAEAPDGLQPFEMLLPAFREAGLILARNLPFSEPRREIIDATPALRERDLAKTASLTEALAEALRHRGVPERLAVLAAHTGWATYHQAVKAWIDDSSQPLEAHLSQAFDDLRALSVAAAHTSAATPRLPERSGQAMTSAAGGQSATGR